MRYAADFFVQSQRIGEKRSNMSVCADAKYDEVESFRQFCFVFFETFFDRQACVEYVHIREMPLDHFLIGMRMIVWDVSLVNLKKCFVSEIGFSKRRINGFRRAASAE